MRLFCGGFCHRRLYSSPIQRVASEPVKDRQGLEDLSAWRLSRSENAFQPYLTPETLCGVPFGSQNTLSYMLSFTRVVGPMLSLDI